jgi:hypothetical protein
MPSFRALAAMLLFALLVGCKSHKPQTECDEETPCSRIGEVCTEGFCVEARCANSSQCPMESYCSGGDCLPGCTEEDDCLPGSTCDVETKTCVDEACTNTTIDCGYREFCNVATGDCYDAGDQYCKFCDEDWECGEGNLCYAHYCGVDCSRGEECPGGFECIPFADDAGNIVTYQCFTYCWLYDDLDNGSFVVAPGPGAVPLTPLTNPPALPAPAGP